jgi:hypothetical protein
MRYLHISITPLGDLKDTTGSYSGGRPRGFWYGHELSWVNFMESQKAWYPSLRSAGAFPYSLRAIYDHAFGRSPLPALAPGEELVPVPWPPHFIYEVPIPASAFSDTPGRGSILRLTRDSLPSFLETARPVRDAWRPTDGILIESVTDALKSKTPTSTALRALAPPKTPNYQVAKMTREILSGIWDGTIPVNDSLRPIMDSFWRDYFAGLQAQWGGIDFADDLFPVPLETITQLSLLRFIDAGSGVLFAPQTVLPSPPKLLTTIRWDAEPGEGVTRIGVTREGQLRSVPSVGGRRRRRATRRRMFKNPKTLKKRIR